MRQKLKTSPNYLLDKVYGVLALHKQGLLQGEIMPEDANPGLPKNSEAALCYFTLPMALNYQRNSYSLWKSALAAYKDPETAFIFSPERVIHTKLEDLRAALLRYKVALQPNKHVEIWQRICLTLVEKYNGRITDFLAQHDFNIAQILTTLTQSKKDFPYLAGPKISNYWLYVLSQYTELPFKNLNALSIAPDTHVVQASVYLGIVPEGSDSSAVALAWSNLLKDTPLSPIEIHTPLWLWSRQNFKPEIADA